MISLKSFLLLSCFILSTACNIESNPKSSQLKQSDPSFLTSEESSDLVLNPGFESGSTSWQIWGVASVVAGQGVNNTAAMRVSENSGFGQNISNLDITREYKLSFNAKRDNSAVIAEAGVSFYNSSWNKISSKQIFLDSNAQKKYDIEFTLPSGTTYLQVYTWRSAGSSSSYVYFDDFDLSVKPAPIPSLGTNMGFESGMSSWGNWENASSVVAGQGMNNSAAMRISSNGGFAQNFSNLDLTKNYKLGFHAKRDNTGVVAEGGVTFYNSSWATISSKKIVLDSLTYKKYEIPFTLPAGTVHIQIYAYRSAGTATSFVHFDDFSLVADSTATPPPAPNQPPVINAGADKSITLPTSSVSLTAVASDPDGSIASYLWTKVSGPASGTMSGANSATLSLSGLVQGEYVYSATVKDNQGAEASDSIKVIVNPAPVAPPAPTLGTNMGFESGMTSWENWGGASSVVSGQGMNNSAAMRINSNGGFAQNFSNLDITKNYKLGFHAKRDNTGIIAEGGVKFYNSSWGPISTKNIILDSLSYKKYELPFTLPAGTAHIQIYAYRSGGTATSFVHFDDFTLVVDSGGTPPPAPNQPPVINAGADKSITLPTNSTSLTAVASDPDGSIASYLWTKVSGPASGTMSGANSATLSLSGLVQGEYVYSATVKDNAGAEASDSVKVTVNSATTPPPTEPDPDPTQDPDPVIPGITYYFAASGNDSYTSTQARNPSTPWKSIAKLNAIIPTLNAGDGVRFKRGDTFVGRINITKSGASNNPIIFGAYGTGARPVLTTLTALTQWTSLGNGIYETTYPANIGKLNLVMIDGKNRAPGRYPKANAAQDGYLIINSISGSTINDSLFASRPNYVGGEIVVRKVSWVTDRQTITGQTSSSITFANTGSYSAKVKAGYFIQNHINTLSEFGEWSLLEASQKLRVHFGTSAPQNHKIEVPTDVHLMNISNSSHLSMLGLNFRGSNNHLINLVNATGLKISHSTLQFAGVDAVRGSNTPSFKLEYSEVLDSQNNGMFFSGAPSLVVRHNTFNRTALLTGLGGNNDGNRSAIQNYWSSDADNTLIEHNKILNTGYLGISFTGNNSIVRYNYIDGFDLVCTDGSGIYTFVGDKGSFLSNLKVYKNIIMNGVDKVHGSMYGGGETHGIYTDLGSNNTEYYDNFIANIDGSGIFVNKSQYITFNNNTVVDAITGMIFTDHPTVQAIGNTASGNKLVILPNSRVVDKIAQYQAYTTVGDSNYNQIIVPFTGTSVSFKKGWSTAYLSLAQWRSEMQDEQNTTQVNYGKPVSPLKIVTNPSMEVKTISLGGSFLDVNDGVTKTQITLQPYEGRAFVQQ